MLKLKDGTIVPGATTILKLLDKPFLVKWANNLGKKNIDVTTYVNQTANLGKLIHSILESHLLKQEIDLSNYTDEEINLAELAFNRYMTWEMNHTLEDVKVEYELVSETYKYGGILDIYCKLDGEYTIIDIKTSKQVNVEQEIQVSSYEQLVRENNLKVDRLLIINLGKELNSQLEVVEIARDKSSKYFKFFKQLVDLYYTKKEIGWND